MDALGHFINGAPFPDDARPQPVTNPATGAMTKRVAMAAAATVNKAVAAAASAFPAWRDTQPLKRARIMFKYKELLERDAQDIAALITSEHGKVIDDAMALIDGHEFGNRTCIFGPDSVRLYTRRKTITQRWPRHASRGGGREFAQFAFPSSSAGPSS